MNQPGNRELASGELSELLGGELPSVLPLEGWKTMELHCQVDAIGTSERHPDLVKLEVSFPPQAAAPARCARCEGAKVVPDTRWNRHPSDPETVPCPECSACTATMLHALHGRVQCSLPAGHYAEKQIPVWTEESHDPGGWHRSAKRGDDPQMCWCDRADAATPHGAPPTPVVEGQWVIPLGCEACGRVGTERHPRFKGVVRCANCKEHLQPVLTSKGAV